MDPTGRTVWQGQGREIAVVDQVEAVDPRKGGVYRIGNPVSGASGIWTLRVTVGQGHGGVVIGAFTVRPDLELFLPQTALGGADGEEGRPLMVLVMPTSRGVPVMEQDGITVSLVDATGAVQEARATGSLRTVLGNVIPLPGGQYAAHFNGLKAGKYKAIAEAVVRGEALKASRDVLVVGKHER